MPSSSRGYPPTHWRRRTGALLTAVIVAWSLAGCAASPSPMRPAVKTMVIERDALAIADDLERLIDDERDTAEDREAAYEAVGSLEEDTAGYAFARAAVAGRLAQIRGLSAIGLVREMERHAHRSIELDPTFRHGAAKRMLGTLYVMAPALLLANGNEDEGMALLSQLVEEHPNQVENHLRLAQGYVETGKAEQAGPYLCAAAERQEALRPADLRLLHELLQQADPPVGAACATSNTTTF